MGVDLTGYKVLYKNHVYQALKVDLMNINGKPEEVGIMKPEFLNVTVIDGNGEIRVLQDEAESFNFSKV